MVTEVYQEKVMPPSAHQQDNLGKDQKSTLDRCLDISTQVLVKKLLVYEALSYECMRP